MNNNGKLTAKQEKFINLVLEGYSLKTSYLKCFPEYREKQNLKYVYDNASKLFNEPAIHNRYMELREMMEKEWQERAIWTREQAINELKELLRKNRIESDRYEQAYDDEMEMLTRQIEEKTLELENPKGYMSKKKKAELQDDIDNLKLARIQCNRRHQSNRNVNEAILSSIQQLNEMLGYNKKPDEKIQLQAQVSFVDNIPEDDKE
nr:MAG TPA: Terminase small subunit [Caudoviricetes sp.]